MSLLDAIRYAAIVLSIAVVILGMALLFMSPGQLEGLFGKIEAEIVDFNTLERASNKNSYLLCSPEHCPYAHPDGPAPVFAIPPERLRTILLDFADKAPNIRTYSDRMDLELQQFDFIERTPAMRFPDIITVRIYPTDDGGSTMAIYSRSVYGQSDFNANRDRITRWLAIITPAEEF